MAPKNPFERRAVFWTWVTVVSGAAAFSGNFLPENMLTLPLVGFVIFIPSFFVRAYYSRRCDLQTRRIAAASAAPAEADAAPVVYLRSFEDDAVGAALRGDITEEEQLVRALAHFGPVLAIGKPGELLPLAGAHRQYVADDQWQARVKELLGRARLVVIRTGLSQGLMWELRTTVELLRPQNVVLACDSANELTSMLRQVASVHPLATEQLRIKGKKLGSLVGFVVFDANWRPIFLRIRRASYLLERHEHQTFFYAALLHTLRPVFDQVALAFPRPQKDPLKIAYLLFCLLFFAWVFIYAITDQAG
jgi:hypothetical protein